MRDKFPENFTPVGEDLAQKMGLIAAAVYGVVWRYCQMDDGVCRASCETMAGKIGVSVNSVRRKLALLVERRYIIDSTPGRRYSPHVYTLQVLQQKTDRRLLEIVV